MDKTLSSQIKKNQYNSRYYLYTKCYSNLVICVDSFNSPNDHSEVTTIVSVLVIEINARRQ